MLTLVFGGMPDRFEGGGAVVGGASTFNSGFSVDASGGAVSGGSGSILIRRAIIPVGGGVTGGKSRIVPYEKLADSGVVTLVLHTTPPQVFTASDRLLSAGPIRRPMGGIIGAMETANASASIDNADGFLTEIFSRPPLAIRARIINIDGVTMFSGLVSSVDMGGTIKLSLEAGERFPISHNVPLISTSQLPGYRTEANIPLAWGSLLLQPVAADAAGQVFIAASHACQAVDEVLIDNAPTQGWTWTNRVWQLSTGTITMATITLAKPLLPNERITCRVRGRMNPRTGGLITNPADIIWDLLANVCGIPLDYSELDRFRSDMTTAGIRLAGLVNDGRRTIRSVVDEIAASCGAVWGGQVPGIAARFLGAVPDTPRAVIRADQISSISITCKGDRIATALKSGYAYDYAQGQSGKSCQMEAPQAILQYGRTETEFSAPWLRDTRTDVLLSEAYLQWKATPQFDIAIDTGGDHMSVMPGWWITVHHPYLPGGSATMLCTDAEPDLFAQTIRITGSIPAGTAPEVKLLNLSSAFDPQTLQGPSVQFANGQATITFTDDAGKPLAGAKVTIDGSQVKTTDKSGRVVFTAARGKHLVKVEATGYQPMEGEIEV